jgi:uncharacterized protein (DUF427 family)
VSLTSGRGPFSANPAGAFSPPVPSPVVYVEPHRRRVRGERDGCVVLDSERVLLVHRPGRPPTYAFPAGDARALPAQPVTEASGYVEVPWDAVDAWYEEDEPITGHPRNPYHRIDCLRSSRKLRVEVAGVVLVDTGGTIALYETALEPRLYVHPSQVRMDLLTRSRTTTYCPYKGTASYWSAEVGGVTTDDVAWSYEDPVDESSRIRGFLSFDDNRVSVFTDLPPTRDANSPFW